MTTTTMMMCMRMLSSRAPQESAVANVEWQRAID